MTKIRGFELVSTYNNQDLLPKRETAHAAGYDLKVAENTMISPGEIVLVPTGVKAYMQPGEVLYLYDRSSNPRKKGLVLINSVGVIDGDYYGNPGNEGHIFAQMKNITDQPVTLEVGERMGFELVGSGQLENRRNLRPDCWLYLLISLSSVGLLA